MKYYRLTLLKDLPEVKVGYSKSFSEESLKSNWGYNDWTDADYVLKFYQDNAEFVKKEIDLSKALPKIKCPHCDKSSLFPFNGEEQSYYQGDGITKWYEPIGVECGLCDYKLVIQNVCTRSKIQW